MQIIFVFTASNNEAQKHLRDTIDNSIQEELLTKHLSISLIENLKVKCPDGFFFAVVGTNLPWPRL